GVLFFFQAEDGIRDFHVTGVQTCALPILAWTKPSRRSLTRPRSWPRCTDWENAWISWPATSFSISPASRRAARRPYSGSSPESRAAVRMDSSSSSRVLAPSYRPEMVRVATRIGSTGCRPSQQRVTARTILFRSTGSRRPLRLVTVMPALAGGGVSWKGGASGAGASGWFILVSGAWRTGRRRSLEGGARGRTPAPGAARPRPRGRTGLARMGAGCRRARDRAARRHRPPPPGDPGPVTARRASPGGRQVFGLADARRGRLSYWPSLPGPRGPSACDGGRFHMPLRGSAGVAPASLLTLPPRRRSGPTATRYRGRRRASTQDIVWPGCRPPRPGAAAEAAAGLSRPRAGNPGPPAAWPGCPP